MRFKTRYKGSEVTLSIAEGQKISTIDGGPTEEGWSSVSHDYGLSGGVLVDEICNDGCDCDGRLTTNSVLVANQVRDNGFPDWREVSSSVYDAYAQAANY